MLHDHIALADFPGPPTSVKFQLIMSCDDGLRAFLNWNPPTNTGGEGVRIDRYLVNVTRPDGYTCPPDQCNVTTPFTTITGLQCNTSYTVAVRAVNSVGESVPSEAIHIQKG